jgi:hypothetical protein
MSFTLEEFTPATLSSVNMRAEMHGSDPIPATDLGLSMEGSNNLLLMFDPALKAALYKREGEADEPEFDELDPTSNMPFLRSSSISMPIALKNEYLGRRVTIDYGLGGKSNIVLDNCDVNHFSVECSEGGSVKIKFRVQASGVSEKSLGKLASLVKHDIKVTVTVSDGAGQDTMPGISPAVDPGPPPEAGDIFVATHAPAAVQAARAVLKAKLGSKKPAKKTVTGFSGKKVAAKKAVKKP